MAEMTILDPRRDPNVVIEVQWLKYAREVGGDEYNIEYARRLCVALLAEHGITDWTVRVGGAKDTAGSVDYGKKRLTLSGPLMSLWTPEQARETILHEIAHIFSRDGHGPKWVAQCRRLGIKPNRLWGEDGEQRIEGQWVGTCPGGHPHRRRRRKPKTQWSCTKCHPGSYDVRFLITWTKEVSP